MHLLRVSGKTTHRQYSDETRSQHSLPPEPGILLEGTRILEHPEAGFRRHSQLRGEKEELLQCQRQRLFRLVAVHRLRGGGEQEEEVPASRSSIEDGMISFIFGVILPASVVKPSTGAVAEGGDSITRWFWLLGKDELQLG